MIQMLVSILIMMFIIGCGSGSSRSYTTTEVIEPQEIPVQTNGAILVEGDSNKVSTITKDYNNTSITTVTITCEGEGCNALYNAEPTEEEEEDMADEEATIDS